MEEGKSMGLDQSDKDALLRIARSAIEARVTGRPSPQEEERGAGLNSDSSAFVTLTKAGELRGCIGTFASPEPLYRTVRDMAMAAAAKDPRFIPVREGELKEIEIEISVLSPLREIKDPEEIEVGRHGVYIVKGRNRGVLLPKVAIDYGYDRYSFLDATCLKAGLKPGAWRDGAVIFVFEAEVFKEKENAL
jgi:AmmeMemoRadiSam system protein A